MLVTYLVNFRSLKDHLFGKELFIRFTASAFRKLPSIYVFSYFPFGFEGRMWDLIVSVPDHCLSFYFGINVDNCLTFSGYVDNIAKKITSNIWLLSKMKRFLSKDHRVQFYKTYIQPHINCCNIIHLKLNLKDCFNSKKRACKIILDYNVDKIFESMECQKLHRVQFYKTYIQPHIDCCNIIHLKLNLKDCFNSKKGLVK